MKFKPAATAKNIAYIALMTALLIGGQFALSFVAGVEIVTVLLLSFSAYFGVIIGVATAVSFCTLRCLIWGFMPNVVLLYFIYYPLFASLFGLLGKIKDETKTWLLITVNVLLLAIISAALCCALFDIIKISRLYKATVTVFLFVVAGLCGGLLITFNILYALVKRKVLSSGKPLKIFLLTAVAAVCTVCFTLLDDIISPLIIGMDRLTALTYFYGSFLAMLPQVVCTVATVSTLYFPLTFALTKACPKSKLY